MAEGRRAHDLHGGLTETAARCSVCNGIGRELPTDCPGEPLSEVSMGEIARGKLDFYEGQWWVRDRAAGKEAMVVAKPPEVVNHPKHYNSGASGIEVIDIIEEMPFNIGTAMKYMLRANHKHASPTDDHRKARWYVEREIARQARLYAGRDSSKDFQLWPVLTGEHVFNSRHPTRRDVTLTRVLEGLDSPTVLVVTCLWRYLQNRLVAHLRTAVQSFESRGIKI